MNQSEQFTQILDTDTFVKTLGEGEPYFVVHGGPGFDHTYMEAGLKLLAERCKLIFYDQPGCGKTKVPLEKLNLAYYAEHFANLLQERANNNPINIIAHSWGTLIVAASLKQYTNIRLLLNAIIFINPVPMTATKYQQSVNNLLAKLPANILAKIQEMFATQGGGDLSFKELLPFYVGSSSKTDFEVSTNKETYCIASTKLMDFDFSDAIFNLSNLFVIRGKDDFIEEDTIKEVLSAAKKYSTISGLGHFPFLEDTHQFHDVISKYI